MMPFYIKKAWRDICQDKASIVLIIISISVCLTAVSTVLNTKQLFSEALQASTGQQNSSVYLYTNLFDGKLPELTQIGGIKNAQARFETPGRLEINGSWKNFEFIVLPDKNERPMIRFPSPPYKPGIYLEKTTMEYYRLKIGDPVSITLPGQQKKELPVAGHITDYDFIPAVFSGLGRAYIPPESLKSLGLSSDKNTIQLAIPSDEYQNKGAKILQKVKENLKDQGITVYRTVYSKESLLLRKQITDTVFLLLVIFGSLAFMLGMVLVIHFFYSLAAKKKQDISIQKVLGAEKPHLWKEFGVILGIMGSMIFFLTILWSAGLSYYFSQYLIQSLNIGKSYFHYSKDILLLIGVLAFLLPAISSLVPIALALKVPVALGLIDAIQPYRRSGKLKAFGFVLFLLSIRNAGRKRVQLSTNILMLSFGGAVIISSIALNNSLTITLKEMQSVWKHDMEWDIRTNLSSTEVARLANQTKGVLQAESWTGRNAEASLSQKNKTTGTLLLALPRESKIIQPEIIEGSWLNGLPKNSIVINSDFQRLAENIKTGDTVSLKIGKQEKTWVIGGVIQGQLNGPAIYMASDDYQPWILRQQPNRVIVKLDSYGKKHSSEVMNNMEQIFSKNNIAVEAFDTVRNKNSRPYEIIALIVYSLLFTGILFTAVGVMNLITAMSVNVLERKHEIGLVRAVGGSQLKIHQLFIGEGLFIAIISWSISAVLSYPLQIILNQKIGNSLINSPLPSSFSPWGLGFWFIISVILGCLASIIPAHKAANLPVRELISGK